MCQQILVRLANIKFNENTFKGPRVVTWDRTDRHSEVEEANFLHALAANAYQNYAGRLSLYILTMMFF